MKQPMRGVWLILLLSLFLSAFTVFAQEEDDSIENEPFNLAGSRVALEAIGAIANANDLSVEANITGTNTGFQLFCSGEVAVVGSIRPISITEEETCLTNEINYNEYLIGYNTLVFITHEDLSFASCLNSTHINRLFSPSSQGTTDDWAQIGLATVENVPLTVFLPPEGSTLYGLLDEQIEGVGLRNDAQQADDYQAMISAISSTEGAIGIVPLSAVSADDAVQIVNLTNIDLGRCITPSLNTVEAGEYTLRNSLLLYVNTGQVESDNTSLGIIIGEDAASALAEAGYTAPSEDSYARNQAILAGESGEGRQFSRDLVAFDIPADVFGQISIGGAASLATYIQATTNIFNSEYPGVTPVATVEGQISAIRRFCSAELDIVALNRELTQDEITVCQNSAVNPITFNIGAQAVVLIANNNVDDGFPACLTRDQVQLIWSNQDEAPTNWSQIDASFPDEQLILVAPVIGSVDYTDILLSTGTGAILTERANVAERNNNPAYRAAAVGNVAGGLTYMSWIDYESIEENFPENARLVGVSDGTDCVLPSVESIVDGSYTYTLSGYLHVKETALARPEVQSYLWYLFQDSNYYIYGATGLTGLPFGNLPAIREELQTTFSQASLNSTTLVPVPVQQPRTFGPGLPFDLFAPATETP